ncbi:MAG: MerR family transcriptional regulator [Defluviitaleaceae bacterium]|nr:MerR family transcriptional regulator [Defluviitaleaceae bacterium]
MSELSKIKDVSTKYAITARTLRYYEDIGLLRSVRTEDYAHRMYDEAAITRLKQILILRKLNISVKDIKRIFTASDSEVVLEVLGKKAEDIDDEVALLHELKGIVLDFINQIKQSDFHNDTQVKQLYDKAKEIEARLSTPEQLTEQTTSTNADRLLDVTEKLEDKRRIAPMPIKAYKQAIGPMRFIGKKYTSGSEAWSTNSPDWAPDWNRDSDQWLPKRLGIDPKALYEDGDSLIGLMNHRDGGFEYWLGYFVPPNTPVPEGYGYEDFPKSEYKDVATCWLYGHNDEVFAIEPMAYEKLLEEGYEVDDLWWFERYHPIRSDEDKKGNVIIDICFFAK